MVNRKNAWRSGRREAFEVPTGEHLHGLVLMLPVSEADRTGQRDHRAVVRAERQTREVGPEAILIAGGSQLGAQALVRAYATGDHQARSSGCFKRAAALDDQSVDNGFLKR